MFEAIARFPVVWGLVGAFMFALPNLRACLAACSTPGGGRRSSCIWEFGVALVVGALMALALAPAIFRLTGQEDEGVLRGIAAILGLCANRIAKDLPEAAAGWIERLFKGAKK